MGLVAEMAWDKSKTREIASSRPLAFLSRIYYIVIRYEILKNIERMQAMITIPADADILPPTNDYIFKALVAI